MIFFDDRLFTLYRKEDCSFSEFVDDFNCAYLKVTEQDISLNDTVVAFLLLSSCQLSEEHISLVMFTIEIVTYDDMKRVLASITVNLKNSLESSGKSEGRTSYHKDLQKFRVFIT